MSTKREQSADAATPRLARNAAAGAGTAGVQPGVQRRPTVQRTATGASGAGARLRATHCLAFWLLGEPRADAPEGQLPGGHLASLLAARAKGQCSGRHGSDAAAAGAASVLQVVAARGRHICSAGSR